MLWSIRCAALALATTASALSLSACGDAETRATNEPVVRCPFRLDADVGDYELPEHLSRAQVRSCQAYFGRTGSRFSPGSAAFSSQFCYRHDRRDECQQVRIAACRLAVGSGEFASMPECLASAPGTRVVLRANAPRLTVLVSEPAVHEGWLDVVDNTMDRWFADGGRISVYRPRSSAWDSRTAQIVRFPEDIEVLLAGSPYVDIVESRSFRLDGARAKVIDLVVRSGDPKARKADLCGEEFLRDMPCVPITADRDELGYVSFWLQPGERHRLVDVHAASGRVVLHVSGFERFDDLAHTDRLLRTLRVG